MKCEGGGYDSAAAESMPKFKGEERRSRSRASREHYDPTILSVDADVDIVSSIEEVDPPAETGTAAAVEHTDPPPSSPATLVDADNQAGKLVAGAGADLQQLLDEIFEPSPSPADQDSETEKEGMTPAPAVALTRSKTHSTSSAEVETCKLHPQVKLRSDRCPRCAALESKGKMHSKKSSQHLEERMTMICNMLLKKARFFSR